MTFAWITSATTVQQPQRTTVAAVAAETAARAQLRLQMVIALCARQLAAPALQQLTTTVTLTTTATAVATMTEVTALCCCSAVHHAHRTYSWGG